jgi:hypothetical protein
MWNYNLYWQPLPVNLGLQLLKTRLKMSWLFTIRRSSWPFKIRRSSWPFKIWRSSWQEMWDHHWCQCLPCKSQPLYTWDHSKYEDHLGLQYSEDNCRKLAFKLKLLKLDNNKYCQGFLLFYFVSHLLVRPEFKIDDQLGL